MMTATTFRKRMRALAWAWCCASLLAWSAVAWAIDLTGAGASSPYPVYAKWAAEYHRQTGHRINYQSMGSGGGQQQILAGTVDFGASDDPLSADWLERHDLIQFPAVILGVVPVVHLPGIQSEQLLLNGSVLADIFLGNITRWDDPAIVSLNPGVVLPAKDIVVVHRADGSGTTFVWSDYLSQASAQWHQDVGRGKAVAWPVGQGGKGNEGVAAYVKQLRYAIGYVEYTYAVTNKLTWTRLLNASGKAISPDVTSIQAAAQQAEWETPGMGVSLNNQPATHAWPIAAASFILVPRHPSRPERVREVLGFFDWALTQAADITARLAYVPLPAAAIQQVQAEWQKVVDDHGQRIWAP